MSRQRNERIENRESTGRRRRAGLGQPRAKLTFPPKAGYVRRVINDNPPGRLELAQECGWQFVTDKQHLGQAHEDGNSDMGSRVSRIVGSDDHGNPIRGYLMEIKEEFYQEDQQDKQAKVDEIDDAIKYGNLPNTEIQEGYIPKGGGIKYKTHQN